MAHQGDVGQVQNLRAVGQDLGPQLGGGRRMSGSRGAGLRVEGLRGSRVPGRRVEGGGRGLVIF